MIWLRDAQQALGARLVAEEYPDGIRAARVREGREQGTVAVEAELPETAERAAKWLILWLDRRGIVGMAGRVQNGGAANRYHVVVTIAEARAA